MLAGLATFAEVAERRGSRDAAPRSGGGTPIHGASPPIFRLPIVPRTQPAVTAMQTEHRFEEVFSGILAAGVQTGTLHDGIFAIVLSSSSAVQRQATINATWARWLAPESVTFATEAELGLTQSVYASAQHYQMRYLPSGLDLL